MPGKNKHFTYDERVFIQQNLNKMSFKDMGRKLEKDCTSISREVRRHTITVHTGTWGKEYNSCAKRDRCPASGLCRMKPCARKTCSGCSTIYATAVTGDKGASYRRQTTVRRMPTAPTGPG